MRIEIALFVIVLISLVLNSLNIHPTFSDDNFYFNVGKKVSEGMVPYKDFFFAHPPLQIYILAAIFKIFGSSYLIAKLYSLLISALCIPIIFLITKELSGEKTAFIAAFAFLITPTFIAFSSIDYGMWEATLFVLISTYFLLKGKPVLSSVSFSVAVLFRYFAIFYFPFLLLILYLRNEKKLKFFLSSFIILSFFFVTLFLVFGQNYFEQTIAYQFFSKVEVSSGTQYWEIGLFYYFLALISALILFIEKDKITFLFASITLIVDPIILLVFKLSFYHYFLISLPFCIMAVSKAVTFRYNVVRVMIPLILFLSIIYNFQTIDYYVNPNHSENFYLINDFIEKNTSKDAKIFGEPIVTNYVSFETGRGVAGNYFDSYLQHLNFESLDKVIEKLERDKPGIFIEMEVYYLSDPSIRKFVMDDYKLERKFEGAPSYSIYKLK